MDKVLLVDFFGRKIKYMDKLKAHQKPMLHLAFSVFLYNGDQVLIQKRAATKYHSGGLWSNACCSHYLSKQDLTVTVKKRLCEELGIICDVQPVGEFTYMAPIKSLYEYEIDSVFVGKYDGKFDINKQEASQVKWVKITTLAQDLVKHPSKYTAWFISAFKIFVDYMQNQGLIDVK